MNEDGKSDGAVVSAKLPNEGGPSPEEAVERRVSAQENVHRPTACRTQRRDQHAHDGLVRVREAAGRNKKERFTVLLHHVTVERLGKAFGALSRSAAPGVDGVIVGRIRARSRGKTSRSSRTCPTRDVPSKAVAAGDDAEAGWGERPLGIAAMEDKIVQRARIVPAHEPRTHAASAAHSARRPHVSSTSAHTRAGKVASTGCWWLLCIPRDTDQQCAPRCVSQGDHASVATRPRASKPARSGHVGPHGDPN